MKRALLATRRTSRACRALALACALVCVGCGSAPNGGPSAPAEPQAAGDVGGRRTASLTRRVVFYVPNRVLDALDLVGLNVGLGFWRYDALVQVTRPLRLGAGFRTPAWQMGFTGRCAECWVRMDTPGVNVSIWDLELDPSDSSYRHEGLLHPARENDWDILARYSGPVWFDRPTARHAIIPNEGDFAWKFLAWSWLLQLVPNGEARIRLAEVPDFLAGWVLLDPKRDDVRSLGELGRAPTQAFIDGLSDRSTSMRRYAVRGLAERPAREAVLPLARALRHDSDACIRTGAARALARTGDPRAVEPLIAALKDQDVGVRRAAVRALGALKDRRAVEPVIRALKRQEYDVFHAAVWALGVLKDPRAVDPLIAELADLGRGPDESARVREHLGESVAESLQTITGQDFGLDSGRWREWWEANKTGFMEQGPQEPRQPGAPE